ncbi:hypothetical protein DFH06DRAFT_1406506 [Mycena polygramma]|nr:hypothetical protein DFH06DRAFT_1406506 [Mycena polygramma]
MLSGDRALVAELAGESALLERSLSALLSQKAQAQERLDAYKYPVLTLPYDILSEIFKHFLPVYPLCPDLRGGILSPVLLTHICRHWREIALTTPILWRALSVTSTRPLPKSEIWLDRSRYHPLSIAIHHLLHPVSEFLSAVIPYRARWEHLRLSIPASNLSVIKGPMPLLCHLDLSLDGPINYSGTPAFTLEESPRLRTVILRGQFATSAVALPWEQLTSLTLLHVTRSQYWAILRQTSNLRQCRLTFHMKSGGPITKNEIALPYLTSLSLQTAEKSRCIDFFIVPALRSLRIPESLFLPLPGIDGLRSFIAKAGCSLRKLHITGARLENRNLYREAFPSIPKLSFDCPDEGESSDEA